MLLLVVGDDETLPVQDAGIDYHSVDATDAIEQVQSARYDGIVLIGPSLGDTFALLEELRDIGAAMPILYIASSEKIEVEALERGADAFAIVETDERVLRARIEAMTRRYTDRRPALVVTGDLSINPVTHEVRHAGTQLRLSRTELKLLELLAENVGRLVPAQTIVGRLGPSSTSEAAYVRSNVHRLRRKLPIAPDGAPYITTQWNGGYELRNVRT